MGEAAGILLGGVCLLLVLVFVFGIPIFLLIKVGQLSELQERLTRVERELQRRSLESSPPLAEPIPTLPLAEPELAVVESRAEPRPRAPRPAPRPDEHKPFTLGGLELEAWIGKRGLGWLAVILLVFATAFFVKYSFDNNLIGPLGRVSLGVLTGAMLCIGGYLCQVRHYRVFCQMLTSAGVMLLYLTTFASFGYYALMPQAHAGIFFVLIVAEAAALAWLYDAPAVALMAVVGGLLTPLLLHTGRDQYQSLFTYLIILNSAAVVLNLLRRHWYAVATVAMIGTQGMFWLWYVENYHSEKLSAALLFQGALFALYLLPSFLQARLRWSASLEDLLRLIVNATIFTATGYVLLDDKYHVWMGVFVLDVAIVYGALGVALSAWHGRDRLQLLVVVAATLGLLAMVFPIQAHAVWIGLGWAVEGALLWWFGQRIRNWPLRAMGAVLLAAAVWRLVLIDTIQTGHDGPFIPIFNQYGLPATLIALCVLFCASVSRHALPRPGSVEFGALWFAGVGGVLLLWFIVSFESYDWFVKQIDLRSAVPSGMRDAQGRDLWTLQQEEIDHLYSTARMALSIVWAVYATLILTIGFVRHNRPLRWTALGIFAVTLFKVTMIDIGSLGGLYRVAAFFILAVTMALGAWIYQRIQFTQTAAEREGEVAL